MWLRMPAVMCACVCIFLDRRSDLCVVGLQKVLEGELVLTEHGVCHHPSKPSLELLSPLLVRRLPKLRVERLVGERRHADARVLDYKAVVKPLEVFRTALHDALVVSVSRSRQCTEGYEWTIAENS